MSLSKDILAEAKRKLQALDKKDAERKRTAELKNNLEGYIYTTKEKVCRKQYAFHFLCKISNILSEICPPIH